MKLRTIFAAAGTLCAAGVLAVAMPLTAAADTDVDAVAYTGVAGNLTPAILPITNPGGVLETGTYTFSGGCAVAVSSDDLPAVSTSCSITSAGSYLNVLCGTGTATGGATVASSIESATVSYTIVFVAGLGLQVVTSPVGGVGVVSIVPTNATSGGCVTAAVSSFNVTGASVFVG